MHVGLLPHSWTRHLALPLLGGGAGLLGWWAALLLVERSGMDPAWDGPVFLAALAGAASWATLHAEDSLSRSTRVWWRPQLGALLGAALALGAALLWGRLLAPALAPALMGPERAADALDPTLAALRLRLGAFLLAGLASGLAPWALRRFRGAHDALLGGLCAGAVAAAAWQLLGYSLGTSLYGASALAALLFGAFHGAFAWSLPDSLYAGWLRVLSPGRFGHRVPVDGPGPGPHERFVGHYPRGMDLHLPAEQGVAELHLSVVAEGGRYTARGLSREPTAVRRFLERVDLRYDPSRPAPLETPLSSGDRILLGEGPGAAELEFLLLPREEP